LIWLNSIVLLSGNVLQQALPFLMGH
jgi:hypothetical protein